MNGTVNRNITYTYEIQKNGRKLYVTLLGGKINTSSSIRKNGYHSELRMKFDDLKKIFDEILLLD